MERLKAAVIGLGRQATEDHLPGLLNSQFAKLEAVCDIDQQKSDEWAAKSGVKGFTDYGELLDSTKLDFVIVATPHDAYGKIVEQAAARKLHVLKEKPFARNLEEAHAIKRICDENGIKLMTTLQRRFNPVYTAYFQLKDQIGEPFFADLNYTLFVNNPHEGWRGKKDTAGGGCIVDMGYHMIDMIIWYLGLPDKIHAEFSCKAKPEEVYDAEDTAHVLFAYDNDLHGSLKLSRYFPPKTEQIRIVGERGIIEVERGTIRRLKSNGELAESLSREHSWPAAASSQIDHFCRVIRGQRENMGSPEYHMQHVSFVEACYLSKTEGRYVKPKELLASYGK
jgi:predicted dehydrogenase